MVSLTNKKKATKKNQSQKQRGKKTLNLNGGGEHAFSDVYVRRLNSTFSTQNSTFNSR